MIQSTVAKQSVEQPIKRSRRHLLYWLAQLLFFTLIFLYMVVTTGAFVRFQTALITIPVLLCLSLLLATHLLRKFYHRHGTALSLQKISLHLCWLLPVLAILIQAALAVILQPLSWIAPSLVDGLVSFSIPAFIAYVINTLGFLIVWTILYLLVAQFRRQQHMEIAYWQSQAQLHKAELQFLHSQINSHFLFNAMNNVRALIREDPEQARDRLTQLSNLLRAVLQTNNKEKITLQEELSLVRDYLSLESIQYEDRLQVKWQIDDTINDFELPPMILQTLVENAISHGIARRAEGGCIEITTRQIGNNVEISVSNPSASHGVSIPGQGIGLDNARKRIDRLFGDLASLELNRNENSVTALLRAPA